MPMYYNIYSEIQIQEQKLVTHTGGPALDCVCELIFIVYEHEEGNSHWTSILRNGRQSRLEIA